MSQWKVQRVERSYRKEGEGGWRSPCCQCWLLCCYLLPAKEAEGRLLQPYQTVKREITVEDRCQCEDIPDLSPESSLKHLNPKTNRAQQGPGIQTRKVESLSVWGGGRRSMAAKIRKHSRSLANCWLFCCGIVSVSQPLSLSLQLILSRSLNYWQDIDGIFIQQIQFTCKIA